MMPSNMCANGYILAVGDSKKNLTEAYVVGSVRMGVTLYWLA